MRFGPLPFKRWRTAKGFLKGRESDLHFGDRGLYEEEKGRVQKLQSHWGRPVRGVVRSRGGKERINLAGVWEGWRRGRNLGGHSGFWLG